MRLTTVRGNKSQPARAQELGVHKNTYARWERDEVPVAAEALEVMLKEGWSANWLLAGIGPARLETLGRPSHKGSQEERPDFGRLRTAIRLLEAGIELAHVDLPPEDKAEVLEDLYGWLADQGDVLTPDNLVDFNRFLSARLKKTGG